MTDREGTTPKPDRDGDVPTPDRDGDTPEADQEDATPITDVERRQLLGASRRQSGTVGGEIPEKLGVRGSTIELREIVFECRRLDAITAEERERIEQLKADLRRERLARRQQLADDEGLTREGGEELVESIRGIDRALNALEGLDTPSLGEQVRRQEIESARELTSLLDLQRQLDGGGVQ